MGNKNARGAFDTIKEKGLVRVKMLHPLGYIKNGHENCVQYVTPKQAEKLMNGKHKHAVLDTEDKKVKISETQKKKTVESVGDK